MLYVVLCNIFSCFSLLFKQKCLLLKNLEYRNTSYHFLGKLLLIFWYIGLHTTGTCLLCKIYLYHLYIIKLLICGLNIEFLVDRCFSLITLDISVHYLLDSIVSDEESDVSHLIEDSFCTMCPFFCWFFQESLSLPYDSFLMMCLLIGSFWVYHTGVCTSFLMFKLIFSWDLGTFWPLVLFF